MMSMTNKEKITRSGAECYLLGQPVSSINGAKLPTMRQVPLLCFHGVNKSGNRKGALKETIRSIGNHLLEHGKDQDDVQKKLRA